jgi:hypothetical protein
MLSLQALLLVEVECLLYHGLNNLLKFEQLIELRLYEKQVYSLACCPVQAEFIHQCHASSGNKF